MFGVLFYPYFACLTTTYKLIGSLMGFVYATIRYEAVMNILLRNQWVGLFHVKTCMAGDKLYSFCNNWKIAFIVILDKHCGKYIQHPIYLKAIVELFLSGRKLMCICVMNYSCRVKCFFTV